MSKQIADDLPQALAEYFERTTVPLSLASVTRTDMPLVLANEAFYDLTGYGPDEVIGENCRFLQGPGTTESSHRAIHDFVSDDSRDAGRFPLVNYRKDGTEFHNYVFMSRLRKREGATLFILASQFDLTSAVQKVTVTENDARLSQSLDDMQAITRGFGMAMIGSAQVLSDSVANVARAKLQNE